MIRIHLKYHGKVPVRSKRYKSQKERGYDKMFLYETHMHTLESSVCGMYSAVNQVRTYKDLGYTGVIITDHLNSKNYAIGRFKRMEPLLSWKEKVEFLIRGYEKAKNEGDKIGLDVFLGWEFDYRGSEFLTYGLDKDFLLRNKDIDEMPIEAYSALVRNAGGYLAQAHPYRKKNERQVPVNPDLVDGVEIFNASRIYKGDENEKAMAFALSHSLPIQAGTDSHQPNRPFYSGIMLDKKAQSVFDIIGAIKTKKAQPILPDRESLLLDREVEKTDSLLVKIFYDTKFAKDEAEKLCFYIQEHMDIDAICANSEEEGKIDKTASVTKTIILGRHSDTKNRLGHMGSLKYDQNGMKYGFSDNLCVLTVSRSELRDSKAYWNKFVVAYCKRFDENPEDESTRTAQFKYVTMEFILSGLHEFLNR